jgi:chorismate--pyruvate lyase
MWAADPQQVGISPDHIFYNWLKRPFRLANAFRQVCQTLRMEVIFEGESEFCADEAAQLQVADATGYVREVVIWGDELPFCYARSIMPMATYRHFQPIWDALGCGFLGDQFLYQQNDMQRSAFVYAVLPATSLLLNNMPAAINSAESYPARRSLFTLDQQYSLLLTEVFATELPAYIEANA